MFGLCDYLAKKILKRRQSLTELRLESTNETWGLRPDVVVSVIQDGAVLLDLDTKYFYSVNSTGWAILQMFERGTSLGQLRTQCHAWGASSDDDSVVDKFLEALFADRLVTTNQDPSSTTDVAFNGKWTPPSIEKHKEPLQRIITSAFDPSIPLAE